MDEVRLTSDAVITRIRIERQMRRLTKGALAQAAGLDANTVVNLESGRRKAITVDEVAAISAALGLSPQHLLFGGMTVTEAAANRPEYMAADELVGEGEDFLDPFNLTKRLGACTICGAMVPEATEQLHADWHEASTRPASPA